MEIKGSGPPITPASLESADLDSPRQVRASVEQWKTNQLLKAVVTDTNPKQTRLNIQGISAQTRTPHNLELQVGQQLTLQVTSKSGQFPDLKIISFDKPVTQLISQQLRNDLPRQHSLSQLLADIKALTTRPEIQRLLPDAAIRHLQRITDNLPQASQLKTPEAVKQALQRSGLFLEQQLGQAATQNSRPSIDAERDIRTALLRLAALLKDSVSPGALKSIYTPVTPSANLANTFQQQTPQAQPTVASRLLDMANAEQLKLELIKQVEASLARIQSLQLTSVKTDETSNLLWAMELPIKNQDSTSIFDIRIQQEQQGHEQQQAQHRWSLSIAFELQGLGPIYVKATLFNEKVSATFWLNEPETHELFHQHLQTLQKRLQDAGLDIEHINLSQGKPEINTRSSWQRIVDEKV